MAENNTAGDTRKSRADFKAELARGKIYEELVARTIAEAIWPGSEVAESPAYADIDFAVFTPNRRFLGLLEVKSRRVDSRRFDTTIVSRRKYDAALYAQRYLKVKTACVVYFTDNLGFFWLNEPPDGYNEILRGDRGTAAVPHVFYKVDRLQFFPELFERVKSRAGVLR